MKNKLLLILPLFFSTLAISQTCAPTIVINGSITRVDFSNTAGNCTWTVPAGATNLFMETWGGGGNGGGAQGATASCPKKGGGGGGGAYAKTTLNLAAGTILNITVGAGGTSIVGAGASEVWTSSTSYARATGGLPGAGVIASQSCFNVPTGGPGGSVQSGTGFSGGAGQAGSTTISGAGGGGANSGSAGGTGASGGNPGTVVAPSTGGGGSGGQGINSSTSGGAGGNSYGGGGGGAWCVSNGAFYGGNGGDGHVRITYCNSIATPVFNAVAPICAGQTLTPLPSLSTNSIAGTWSPALNNTITKTYTFSPSGQCASTNTLTIVVNALPTITANATSSAVCLGQSTTLSGAGASTYTWSGGITNGTAFTPTATTIYTVTGTAATGCTNTATRQITVNTLPVVTANATSSIVCLGQSTTLSGAGASTYTWSGGITNGTAFTPTVNATYTVTGTDVNGCSSAGVQSIIVNNLPAANINTSGPTTFCQGGSVILTADASNSYLWSNGATTQSISTSQSGNYTVQVSDINGCSSSSSVTSVNVNPTLVANITAAGATTFCQGGSVLLTANSANSYLWSNGAITQTINVTQAGNYSVQLTSGAGCSGSSSITTIVVNPLPNVTLGSIQSPLCVNNATVPLSGNPAGGIYSGIGVSGSSFDPAVSGAGTFTINYTYTNVNMCSAIANQTVNVNLCTGILELNNETVSVYPNPTSTIINVKMNTTLINNATLELYDATGKLITQQKVVNEYSSLNLNGLANGIYSVRIITDNKQTIKRIVKQ